MLKVMTIGGATLDVIIQYEDMETLVHQRRGSTQSYLLLEEGKKIEVIEQKNFSGGGATNTAVAFKRQGYDVKLFCKVGEDAAGKMVLADLAQHGLDTSQVRTTCKAGTATSFVVPSLKGDRTVFAYRGANAALLTEDLPLEDIKDCDFIYITSLSQASSIHLPVIAQAASTLGVKVAVNPGISQLKRGTSYLRDTLPLIDTLILNEEEAQQLMVSLMQDRGQNQEIKTGAEKLLLEGRFEQGYFNLREFFQEVLKLGPRVVTVTAGSDGVYVATEAHLYFHQAPKVSVVNTLGAGDAFGSGFTGALYQGHPIAYALRAGVLNSASVIQYPDAKTGLLSQAELALRLKTLPANLLTELSWR